MFGVAMTTTNITDIDTFSDEECIAYIKANDRNGYETLEGEESITELREACREIFRAGL